MSNYKVLSLILAVLAVCAALASCMRNDAARVDQTPEPTASYAPRGGATAGPTAGVYGESETPPSVSGATVNEGDTSASTGTSAFDWMNGAADIEKAIGQLSEISEARVVVADTTALVGVKFDPAYKGEMTERIRQMVASEVLKADPAIQTVAVTAHDADVQKVYALSDQVRAGRTVDQLKNEINAIVRSATTLR